MAKDQLAAPVNASQASCTWMLICSVTDSWNTALQHGQQHGQIFEGQTPIPWQPTWCAFLPLCALGCLFARPAGLPLGKPKNRISHVPLMREWSRLYPRNQHGRHPLPAWLSASSIIPPPGLQKAPSSPRLLHGTCTAPQAPTATRGCTQGHAAPVCALAVSPASPLLASAEEGASALIRLWRLEDGACLSLLHGMLQLDKLVIGSGSACTCPAVAH